MTDRGSPLTDGAPACPFVAFEDERDERSNVPDHRHRCYAEARPEPRALAHQEAYCLSPSFASCPIFQDWARREAARARPARGIGGLAPSGAGAISEADEVPRAKPDEAAEPAAAASEADPLSSGNAARRRSAGRSWASPPPWAASSGAAAGAAGAAASGAGTASEPGPDHEGRANPAETPAFLATRERAGDREADDRPTAARAKAAADAPVSDRRPTAPPAADQEGWVAAGADEVGPDEQEYDERPARPSGLSALAGLGGLFRRDPRPRAGAPRPVRQADIDRGAPSWERPRRSEAYPTLKTRIRMPAMSPLIVGLLALAVAAIVLFALPGFFLNSGSPTGGSSPTPSAGASAASSATPVPSPTQQTYTVAKGDTATRIAKKFNLTLDQLLAANPQIKDPNKITVGSVLIIPKPAASSVTDTSSPSPSP